LNEDVDWPLAQIAWGDGIAKLLGIGTKFVEGHGASW
jgi:hypothetical protein